MCKPYKFVLYFTKKCCRNELFLKYLIRFKSVLLRFYFYSKFAVSNTILYTNTIIILNCKSIIWMSLTVFHMNRHCHYNKICVFNNIFLLKVFPNNKSKQTSLIFVFFLIVVIHINKTFWQKAYKKYKYFKHKCILIN